MLPAHLQVLPKMPLTPNGKIDRKALPAADFGARVEAFVAPRTPTEQWLAQVWQELLRVGRVGVTDDFFSLGGHSLLAAQLMARLGKERDVKLSLRRIFEAPTIEKLAQLIDGRAADAGTAVVTIPRRADPLVAPQSLMQRRLWYLDQLAGGDIGYNTPSAFRLHGALDVGALERTLHEISRRHETLRTSFDEAQGQPIQRVHPDVRLSLERERLDGVPEGERVKVIAPLLQREADHAFDLRQAPIAKARLFTFAPDDNVLFFMPHHIVWDGWSFDLFLSELSAIYGAFAAGRPSPLSDPEVQYGDFAAWHNAWLSGPQLERQAEYWLSALKPPLTPLELSGDRPRPQRMSGKGGFEPLGFTRDEQDALAKVARRLDATPYMVLLATFDALLHRYTGAEDLLIGTPVRGRSQPQVEKTLGFFVNTLVLRQDVASAQRFDALVSSVKRRVLDAFSHPDMPFELLVERLKLPRDPSRTPVFQAMFSYQEASGRSGQIGELPYTQLHVMSQGAMTDLVFWLLSKSGGMAGGLSYNADILEPATARRFLQHFKRLLDAVIEDPTRTVGELALVTEPELQAMRSWNAATVKPLPATLLVHEQVAKQVAERGDAVAVSHRDTRLTYAQLGKRANAIAAALVAKGVKPGDLVGLCVERSCDMLAAMLGILQSGAAYVPLDPAYPEDRIAFMAEDAKLKVVVTEQNVIDELTLPDVAPQLLLDDVPREAAAAPAVGPLDPEGPAYVIYTSGSTGKPKGVVVPHRAVTSFLQSMQREPGLTAGDVMLAVTTLSFDIAVLELWLPLSTGARVVIASREDSSEAERLRALMAKEKPTVLQATPVTWRMLLDGGWAGDPALKALIGGEALPLDLARRLVDKVGSLWNMYGPTETTVWSTLERITAPVERVLIGRPIDNTALYVLDAGLKPVPLGVPGELFIGGAGVTKGYLHRPELTKERFLPDPFAQAGALMYRTGDLARFTPDGRLECLGRNDGQVKVRGHRIEVGEIETRLCAHPDVKEACVVARDDGKGDKRLVAYVVPKADALDALDLRKHARRALPDYMVPNAFEELPALPRTPNGKVDRKALPAPKTELEREAYVAPRTEAERLVADIWAQVLSAPRVGAADNFFDLGGHSLLAFKVLSELERRGGKRVSARTLMLGTLEQVAAELSVAAAHLAPPAEVVDKAGLGDRLLGRIKGLVKS
jgi:amino acid adenylation domain-containing protein